MKNFTQRWRENIKDKIFVKSLVISFLFLFASFGINFFTGTYATKSASLPVTDIVLSNIRVYDVD